MLVLLVILLLILGSFYLGIVLGIKDCKRRFGIPKKAVGLDIDGNYEC